jgi:hypothetical protein
MANRLVGLFTVLGLIGGTAAAQDARSVLQAAAKNMGADTLKCITYSGTGYVGIVGQNFSPSEDWARVELASYSRSPELRRQVLQGGAGSQAGEFSTPRRRRNSNRGGTAPDTHGPRQICVEYPGDHREPRAGRCGATAA